MFNLLGPFKRNEKMTCEYCGAKFTVKLYISIEPPMDEEFELNCPECNYSFRKMSNVTPKIKLIQPRNDGRDYRF